MTGLTDIHGMTAPSDATNTHRVIGSSLLQAFIKELLMINPEIAMVVMLKGNSKMTENH